jgi:hypothetical protein
MISAIEGVVENGQIRLLDKVALPEHARVFVVVPEMKQPQQARIYSPRLVHPEQVSDFAKEVVEVRDNA